jgi:hypothetical protein
MVHKVEVEKPSEEITMGNVAEFYKEVFTELKPKPKTPEEIAAQEKKDKESWDLDGGHVV